MKYQDLKEQVFTDKKLTTYISTSLRMSMNDLGYSQELTNELTTNLIEIDVNTFVKKHYDELHRIHTQHFFGKLVPDYFRKNIVPEIPVGKKVFDLGCGRGTMAKLISERGKNYFVGVDISVSDEWKDIESDNIKFKVLKEEEIDNFIKQENLEVVLITWALHHMTFSSQKKYIETLHNILDKGARIIVLEDSYSTDMAPENGKDKHGRFMVWSPENRQKIMGALDLIANQVLGLKEYMPVPFAYRTLEEWEKLFTERGFKLDKKRYLGFPENRDINTPQSLLILSKE